MSRYITYVVPLIIAVSATGRAETPAGGGTLSFQSCLKRGLRHYPTLKQRGHELLAARERTRGALYEAVLPTVSAGYGVTSAPGGAGDNTQSQVTVAVSQPSFWGSQIRFEADWMPGAAGTFGYRVQMTQSLLHGLVFSERKLRHEDSVLGERKQALEVRAEKQRLRYLIAAAYLDLVLAHEERGLLLRSEASIARLEQAVKSFIDSRIVPRADAVPIQQQLTQNRIRLAQQRQKIALHENQLRELTGLPLRAYHDPGELRVALRRDDFHHGSRHDQAPRTVTLKVAELELERLRLQQRQAFWASLPRLEAGVSVHRDQYGYDQMGTQVGNKDRVWLGTVSLKLDSMLVSRIKKHRELRGQVRALAEQVRLQRLQERRNWRRIKNAIDSSESVAALLEEEARLARQKAANQRELYRVGKSNIFVVLSYFNESYAVIHRGLINRLQTYKLMQELRWVEGE